MIVAGATGSGKSTTLAGMVSQLNESRPCHIVTIEDPIEVLYTDNEAFISQREVGIDTSTLRPGPAPGSPSGPGRDRHW